MKKLMLSLVLVVSSFSLAGNGDTPPTSPNKEFKTQKTRGAQAWERQQAFKNNPRGNAQRAVKKLTFGQVYQNVSPKKQK